MYCKYCGNKINENANYCLSCGKKLETNNQEIENHNEFSKSAKTWMILCIVAQSFVFILNLILGAGEKGIALYLVILGLSLVGLISYLILLIKKKKIAFFIICVVTFAVFLLNLYLNIEVYIAIFGLSNPLITYFIIKNDWDILN